MNKTMSKKTSALEHLELLARALKLPSEPQDWGIIHADADRLGEFIEFWSENPQLSGNQKFELGELIFASANELLLEKPYEKLECLRRFISTYSDSLKLHLEYWSGLGDNEEFPLSSWLTTTNSS